MMFLINHFDFKFILIYLRASEANMNLARRLFSSGRSSSTSKQPVLEPAKSPTPSQFIVGSKTSKAAGTHRLPPSNAQKAGGGIPRPQTATQKPAPVAPKMPPSGRDRMPRHGPGEEQQMREGIRKDSLK